MRIYITIGMFVLAIGLNVYSYISTKKAEKEFNRRIQERYKIEEQLNLNLKKYGINVKIV